MNNNSTVKMINKEAVEARAYDNFCYPLDDSHLKISIKTGNEIQKIFLIYGDPFCINIIDGKEHWNGARLELTNPLKLENGLMWSAIVEPQFKRCRYYFELHSAQSITSKNSNTLKNNVTDNTLLYFLETGFYTATELKEPNTIDGAFTFPWMNTSDIARVPLWPRDIVWYQIFPSRFARGSHSKKDDSLSAWANSTCAVKNSDRFGGNLEGIIEHLDYLENLGIGGIYLNPINLSKTQHKYDTIDYKIIDYEFGDTQTMQTLVKAAHARGIKVMLDAVFNHTGSDFFAWKDILKNKEKSKYKDWYIINDFDFNPNGNNAHENKYFSFAFCDDMPKLNTNNIEVQEYLIEVCEYWIKTYNIDALRFDVANELSHEFLYKLRKRLLSIKNDFYFVGEIWHSALPWLRGNEFDSVMNYPLQNTILDFFTKKNLSCLQLEQNLNRCLTMYFAQTNSVLFNLLDSHDTIRLMTKTKNADVCLQELAFMFCMPGSSCIFYGTEILLEGEDDPDCRRCMPWTEIESGKYNARIAIIKSLIKARRAISALRENEVEFIYENKKSQSERFVHLRKRAYDVLKMQSVQNNIDNTKNNCNTYNAQNKATVDLYFNATNSTHKIDLAQKKVMCQNNLNGNVLEKNGFAIIISI